MAVLSRLLGRKDPDPVETEPRWKIPRLLRVLFIAFLVLRLVTTARQLRREIARLREEGLVPGLA